MGTAGRWRARVGRPGGETVSELEFAEDGTATLTVGGTGSGTWTGTGPDTFSYWITEELPGGTIEIAQNAVLNGDEFISSGITKVRHPDGNTAPAAHKTITAKRIRTP
jgi:hypothetical protein